MRQRRGRGLPGLARRARHRQLGPARPGGTRTLMRQVIGAIAEYEKSMIVLKLRGARNRKRAKTGRCEGRKPYGFYPGEKKVIERMKALREQGTAYDKLAEQLTTEGFRTRKGTAWHGYSVQRILGRESNSGRGLADRR